MSIMKKMLAWTCLLAMVFAVFAVPVAAEEVPRYEAEDAIYQQTGLSTNGSALTGFQNNPQAFASFTVKAEADGDQTIKVKYTSAADTKLTLVVNGTKVGELSFTKGDGNEQTAETSVALKSGDNQILLWNEFGTVKQEFGLNSIEVAGTNYPATEAFYMPFNMSFDSSHQGFSGTGFVAGFYMNCGSHIQFSVTVEADGEYDVTVGYANGNSEAKGQAAKLGVYVNGTKQKDTLLVPGQAWNTYLRKTEQLTLKKGENTITYWYEDTSVMAAPNFDYIEIAPKGTASDQPGSGNDAMAEMEEHNKSVLPFTVSPNKEVTMEAEDAKWHTEDPYKSVGINNEHSGYNGTGFVAGLWDNPGSSVEFPLDVIEAGAYTLTVRYANGAGPAAVGIYLNGECVEKFDFVSSGGWASWAELQVEVQLTTETTSLAIVSERGEGQFGLNLDGVSLAPVVVNEPTDSDSNETNASTENDQSGDDQSSAKPNSGNNSTNVEPEKDYTIVVLAVVGVCVLILFVLVILIAKNVLFKGNAFFDKVFKR